MKQVAIIAIAVFLFACNSNQQKPLAETSTAKDSSITNINEPVAAVEIIAHDSIIPVPPNRLIVPGKSIGLTFIDQNEKEVMKHLSEPATGDAAMGGHSEAIWYSKPVVHGTDTVINETDVYFYTDNFGEKNAVRKVDHIKITSDYFQTSDHIRIGSSLDSIQKYFPHVHQTGTDKNSRTNKEITIYGDEKAGIEFEVEEGKCVRIGVYKPY